MPWGKDREALQAPMYAAWQVCILGCVQVFQVRSAVELVTWIGHHYLGPRSRILDPWLGLIDKVFA